MKFNKLFDHINFLLHSHDCVIVPDFGAFIINRQIVACKNNNFTPPTVSISFNQEVKYNDGLLITHYLNNGFNTYETASKKIKEAVTELRLELKKVLLSIAAK